MLAGEIYDANNDKGLIEKRIIAKELCKKYNELHVRDIIGKKRGNRKIIAKSDYWKQCSYWCWKRCYKRYSRQLCSIWKPM